MAKTSKFKVMKKTIKKNLQLSYLVAVSILTISVESIGNSPITKFARLSNWVGDKSQKIVVPIFANVKHYLLRFLVQSESLPLQFLHCFLLHTGMLQHLRTAFD